MLRRILSSRRTHVVGGFLMAGYLRLVRGTNPITVVPEDAYQRIEPHMPVIIAMWHGQHFLMPFIRQPHHEVKVLISRHRDGELNAQAAEQLGIGTIRGSGATAGEFLRKGGVPAFREMLDTLERGVNVALTADVPKVARRAGEGIVKLAALSGRPIVPVAIATSRRIVLDNWDRTTINLPFGRMVAVLGDTVRVDATADTDRIEAARRAVEDSLNAATERAYRGADRRGDD